MPNDQPNLGQKNYSGLGEDSHGVWWVVGIVSLLLIVVILAASLYFRWWDPYGLGSWIFGSPKTETVLVAAPVKPSPPVLKPSPVKPVKIADAGKDCLKQQVALLAKAREETLAHVTAIAETWRKRRPADADAFIAYVTANPNGDPNTDGTKKADVLEGKVEWNLKLPGGGTHHYDDERHVCICHNWHSEYKPPPLVVRILPPLEPVSLCIEYDYTVNVGDQVRYAAFTRGRMPAACWKLCDGSVCSAPPSPCTICDWLGAANVPEEYSPNYTGVYIARYQKQRFFAPVQMKNEYFVICVDRDGEFGDSDSWIAEPSEWGRGSVYRVPSGQWPVWN